MPVISAKELPTDRLNDVIKYLRTIQHHPR